jgi:hypothetical protein
MLKGGAVEGWGQVTMAYEMRSEPGETRQVSVPTPQPRRVQLGRDSEADALSAQGAVPPLVSSRRASQRSAYSEESLQAPVAAREAIPSRARWQAREVVKGIDALSAQQVGSPRLRRLARTLARELNAWSDAEHSTKPAENPERLAGTLTDQIRPVRQVAHDLVGQLTTARENSEPLREQLAGAIKAAGELDRELTRLLNNDPSPGLATPSPGGPAETFAMEGPVGDRPVARVTPQLFPATLEVAAPSHGRAHVPVLARFFPAHTVHARRSTAVVAGDHCQLKSVDHYHVHRLSLSLDPLLKPGSAGHAALQKLLANRAESGFAQFRRSMQDIAYSPEHRETRASVPVREDPHTVATSSGSVQMGDGSHTSVTTHYLVDESELQIVELLARDRDLARSLVKAVDEPEPGAATRAFLRDAARSAGRTDDLALLDQCTGLRVQGTSIYWLFGVDAVSGASAVMVGKDNELRTGMRVDRGGLSRSTLLADLGRARSQAEANRNREDRTDLGGSFRLPGVSDRGRTSPDSPGGRAALRPPEGGLGRGSRRRDTGRGDTGRGGLGRG